MPDDPKPSKAISGQDVPHRLTVNGIWELPVGRGRRFATSAHPAAEAVIGGWQFQGIYTYQSGFPIGFGNIIFTGNLDDIALPASERTVARWFNTDAGFNKVSAQQLGSNLRTFPLRLDSVRTDTVNNIDLSVIKNTQCGRQETAAEVRVPQRAQPPIVPRPNGNSLNPTTTTFGTISASTQQNYARRTQVMVKFIF